MDADGTLFSYLAKLQLEVQLGHATRISNLELLLSQITAQRDALLKENAELVELVQKLKGEQKG